MKLHDEIETVVLQWGGIFANPDVRETVVRQLETLLERAQADEREACARLAVAMSAQSGYSTKTAECIADAIRARNPATPETELAP